jgi:hypothetical protein
MTKQEHEISKALDKIEKVYEEITQKGLDDSLCQYWSRELFGPISNIKQALNIKV